MIKILSGECENKKSIDDIKCTLISSSPSIIQNNFTIINIYNRIFYFNLLKVLNNKN